ncbi:MAG: hypothetical protein SH848_07075 [Saprospiraceae bacterium]|nr:hypothetical protein [Saprospiraceae bacterium]MDZ4703673.1 hypothetical protein [Saprospiraceae bacterium]
MKIPLEKIKNLVIEGELEDALNLLNEGAESTPFENESTLLFSRFNKIKKEKSNNIISEEIEQREHNKIVVSILELLDNALNSFFYDEVLFDKLLFFETPQEVLTPKQDRQYFTEFDSEKTRCIGWELFMRYPKIINNFDFTIKWQLIKANNQVMPKVISEFNLQEGWTNSWMAHSWGTTNPGSWEKGKSAIKLYIGDKLVSEGAFLIK